MTSMVENHMKLVVVAAVAAAAVLALDNLSIHLMRDDLGRQHQTTIARSLNWKVV